MGNDLRIHANRPGQHRLTMTGIAEDQHRTGVRRRQDRLYNTRNFRRTAEAMAGVGTDRRQNRRRIWLRMRRRIDAAFRLMEGGAEPGPELRIKIRAVRRFRAEQSQFDRPQRVRQGAAGAPVAHGSIGTDAGVAEAPRGVGEFGMFPGPLPDHGRAWWPGAAFQMPPQQPAERRARA
jgi:hypothetical protein